MPEALLQQLIDQVSEIENKINEAVNGLNEALTNLEKNELALVEANIKDQQIILKKFFLEQDDVENKLVKIKKIITEIKGD